VSGCGVVSVEGCAGSRSNPDDERAGRTNIVKRKKAFAREQKICKFKPARRSYAARNISRRKTPLAGAVSMCG